MKKIMRPNDPEQASSVDGSPAIAAPPTLGKCFECDAELSLFCPACNIQSEADSGVRWIITPKSIEWTMPWSTYLKADGTRQYPDREDSAEFETEKAVAHLLLNEVVYVGSGEPARLWVTCNDVFAWGCADGEDLPSSQIETLYRMWRKDPSEGHAVWACIQRKEMPQRPVEKAMRAAGWDLEALKAEHSLRANHYDGVSHVFAKRKYDAYVAWVASLGQKAVEWTAAWWQDGWAKFTAAHPDWNSSEWKAGDDAARDAWRRTNGWEPTDHEDCSPGPVLNQETSAK